jgi:outer membrane receptor protein involved in Fe transport
VFNTRRKALLLSSSFVGLLAFSTAGAADQTYQFDIPAESLGQALTDFSKASSQQIAFSEDATAGKRAGSLHGRYTVDQALRVLLKGTGLSAEVNASGVLMVQPKNAEAASSDGAARSPAQSVETVTVTGTRIAGSAPVGSNLIVIGQQDIRQSGYTSLQQVLQALPQNFRGGSSGASSDTLFSSGSLSGENFSAGSGINLKGLGTTATLTLINGHRTAPSDAGTYTDISVIPLATIDHVDVLDDGASAIYGSDAVAGVVNVVLRKDFDGAQTQVRYGGATEGGMGEFGANQMFGQVWNGGGFVVDADFDTATAVMSDQRSFTSEVQAPTTLIPKNEQFEFSVAGHEELGAWEFHTDNQYAQSNRFSQYSSAEDGGIDTSVTPVNVTRWNTSAGLSYAPLDGWRVSLDGTYGTAATKYPFQDFFNGVFASNEAFLSNKEQVQDYELNVAGDLFDIPGGTVKLVFGGAGRVEDYQTDQTGSFGESHIRSSRNVVSGYAEAYIPIVTELNGAPGVRKLLLDVAGRIDSYSDVGSTINPKVGVSWFPAPELEVAGSYSTSFRAPATGYETQNVAAGTEFIILSAFDNPNGDGSLIPVADLFGSKNLTPEKATNLNAHVTYHPELLPDWSFTLDWYNVHYSNRIITPPGNPGATADPTQVGFIKVFATNAALRQVLNGYLSNGTVLLDFTGGQFGSDPLSVITTLYDGRQQNAPVYSVGGLDLTANGAFEIGENHLDLNFNAAYLYKLNVRFSAGAPSDELLNTYGNPVDLRFRTSATWTRGNFSSTVAVNFTDSYRDTSTLETAPVTARLTIDLRGEYKLDNLTNVSGLAISVFATNLFDQKPPYIIGGGGVLTSGAHYDSANADPLGRFVGFDLTKAW